MTNHIPNDLSRLSDAEFNSLCPQGEHAPGPAMTDFRVLCKDLSIELDRLHTWYIEDNGCNLPDLEALLCHARAAIADELEGQ
jgi:hypothetical protein